MNLEAGNLAKTGQFRTLLVIGNSLPLQLLLRQFVAFMYVHWMLDNFFFNIIHFHLFFLLNPPSAEAILPYHSCRNVEIFTVVCSPSLALDTGKTYSFKLVLFFFVFICSLFSVTCLMSSMGYHI